MNKPTNPLAFPRNILDHGHGVISTHESGMTLRDYFAAKAMHSLYVSNYEYEFTGKAKMPAFVALMDELAIDAYQIADAMLKAREANE